MKRKRAALESESWRAKVRRAVRSTDDYPRPSAGEILAQTFSGRLPDGPNTREFYRAVASERDALRDDLHALPDALTPEILAYIPGGAKRRLNKRTWSQAQLQVPDRGLLPAPVFEGYPDESSVGSVSFSPDGNLLAVGHSGGLVNVWDVRVGQRRFWWSGDDLFSQVAFSPDGRRIMVAGGETPACEWDFASGAERRVGADAGTNVFAYSPDGSHVACVDDDRVVRVWRLVGAQRRLASSFPYEGPEDVARQAVAFAPDGIHVAVEVRTEAAARIVLRDIRTGAIRCRFPPNSGRDGPVSFCSLAFSGRQRDYRVLSAAPEKVQLWVPSRTGPCVQTLDAAEGAGEPYQARFSPDGRVLVASFGEGWAEAWLARTGESIWGFETEDFEALRGAMANDVKAVEFSPSGHHLALGLESGKIVIIAAPAER